MNSHINIILIYVLLEVEAQKLAPGSRKRKLKDEKRQFRTDKEFLSTFFLSSN